MRCTFLTVAIAACFASLGVAIAQDLPQAVTDLGLTNIEIHKKPRPEYGRNVHGTLPGGSRVEIDLDRNNVIKEIEARGDGLFPVSAVQSLVPASVTKNASWPADARLEKIEFESAGRIEIEGRLADGRKFDAEFAADGLMIDFDADH